MNRIRLRRSDLIAPIGETMSTKPRWPFLPKHLASLAFLLPIAFFLPVAHTKEIIVETGDTLFSIASLSRASESITVAQQSVAMLELNPRAFADGNINGMRYGATLKVPTQEQAEAVDANQAARQVREQEMSWATRSKPVEPRGDPEPALHKVTVIRGTKVEETVTVIRN